MPPGAGALLVLALTTLTACERSSSTAAAQAAWIPRAVAPPGPYLDDEEALEGALAEDLFRFASAVSSRLNDRDASPPPINTYSHETAYSHRTVTAGPYIDLKPSRTYSALASTDCSGWVSFAVDVVSPLHHAVLQSQRHRQAYNHDYGQGFKLRESARTWARAFVLTNFFRSDQAWTHGFEPLSHHEHLRPGDLVAYSLGRYIDPSDASLPRPKDTGHTFIVAGPSSVVDPATPDYDGRGTLADTAVEVIAVPVLDASSVPHFDPDSRKNAEGRFALPKHRPGGRVRPGGIGLGTAWLALDRDARVIQRRLGPRGTFRDVVIGAVRPTNMIALSPEILDARGDLVVENFKNAPTRYAGAFYGRQPIDIVGAGGIRHVGGQLVLGGHNGFSGGVTVEEGWLVVTSDTGLGTGDLEVRGGHVHMQRPALADHASLRLAPGLPSGSVRLAFHGEDRAWSLEIDGHVYGCGTWGSPHSQAVFRDRRFSGPGQLRLIGEDPRHCHGARRASSSSRR